LIPKRNNTNTDVNVITEFRQARSEAGQRQEASSIDQIERNTGPINTNQPLGGNRNEGVPVTAKLTSNIGLVTGAPLEPLEVVFGGTRRARSVSCL